MPILPLSLPHPQDAVTAREALVEGGGCGLSPTGWGLTGEEFRGSGGGSGWGSGGRGRGGVGEGEIGSVGTAIRISIHLCMSHNISGEEGGAWGTLVW